MHLAEFSCIPYYVVHELQDPLKKYFRLTKAKAYNWKVRLACYTLAAQTLGCVTKNDRVMVKYFRTEVGK
jgi:hypothetical protein